MRRAAPKIEQPQRGIAASSPRHWVTCTEAVKTKRSGARFGLESLGQVSVVSDQRFAASSCGPRRAVGQSVLRARRRSRLGGSDLVGSRRKAKPWRLSLGSAERVASFLFTKVAKFSSLSGTLQVFLIPAPVKPNPSLKRSANGRPPGPVWRYAVHFRQPGPGVLPLSPA